MTHKYQNLSTSHVFPRLPLATPKIKIGILGGSFNPPHNGHLHISLHALKRLDLDSVWWLVSPGNPLKSHDELLSLQDRIDLCADFSKHFKIQITAFEAIRNSPYTYDSLRYLSSRFSQTKFVWIMGADNLKHFHKWQKWKEIIRLMPILIVDRPQYRYQALSSNAAQYLRPFYKKEEEFRQFFSFDLPAWTFLNLRLNSLSSTDIRAGNVL